MAKLSLNVDILFAGSCGFFLRYTQTGQCIVSELATEKNCSEWYWAIMVDNCLDKKAKFSYFNGNILHHVATGGNLARSQSNLTYNNRLVLYGGNNLNRTNSSKCGLRQTTASPLNFYDGKVQSCVKTDGNYLITENKCQNGGEKKFTLGKNDVKVENLLFVYEY